MRAVRSKDTSIEVKLRRELFARGFRFRKNVKSLPGKPDIVLPKYKTVIFIHGCFWHRHHNCKLATMPQTRLEYWEKKFATNIARDTKETEELIKAGWHVIIVWECELKKDLHNIVGELIKIMLYMLPSSGKRLLLPGMACFIKDNQSD